MGSGDDARELLYMVVCINWRDANVDRKIPRPLFQELKTCNPDFGKTPKDMDPAEIQFPCIYHVLFHMTLHFGGNIPKP